LEDTVKYAILEHCKECGGKGVCEHGRRRSSCKECRVQKCEEAELQQLQEQEAEWLQVAGGSPCLPEGAGAVHREK